MGKGRIWNDVSHAQYKKTQIKDLMRMRANNRALAVDVDAADWPSFVQATRGLANRFCIVLLGNHAHLFHNGTIRIRRVCRESTE